MINLLNVAFISYGDDRKNGKGVFGVTPQLVAMYAYGMFGIGVRWGFWFIYISTLKVKP